MHWKMHLASLEMADSHFAIAHVMGAIAHGNANASASLENALMAAKDAMILNTPDAAVKKLAVPDRRESSYAGKRTSSSPSIY